MNFELTVSVVCNAFSDNTLSITLQNDICGTLT